jgi:glycosyltransferase involved in cell wall biosynthesis
MKGNGRVAYDSRLAIEPFRGMGRYLRTLIAGRRDQFIGFCASGESSDSLHLIADGFRFYPLWEQWSLPRLVAKHDIGMLIAPYNTAPLWLPNGTRLVLVVHDLIFLDDSPLSHSIYQNVGRIYRRMVVPRAVHRASVILTVSEYTKSRIVERFAIAPGLIHVIPNSIDTEWFERPALSGERERFIFMVSGEAPSKNLMRGIESFARLVQRTGDRQILLKIAGAKRKFHAPFVQAAERLGVGQQVELLGYVSDQALRSLYQTSQLFVLPSISEGFGIPVLEAMASGVPVALSSGGSLPEVGGDAALYFDPYSIEDMASRMIEILNTETVREKLTCEGEKQARKFHEAQVRPLIEQFWKSIAIA